jgi:histidine triad (HIT) family protein
MQTCIFCDIIAQKKPASIIFEDDKAIAIKDLNPQAPYHALIIPRGHIATLNDIEMDDEALIGHLFTIAKTLAQKEGFDHSGYRTVFNCNKGAGQVVFHLHLHLLAGRAFHWPPG